ncbi:MAG: hypothetical protein LC541_07020 [Candidatus Thiodiazotropha sp.]|nr:hypothetical protein [Candidatus Thiodiazotropha sp.]MCM8883067.1 hypothetical protein [Candidatus Thiodiazotropha sp.]MCM8922049.1 hypothetical protein [Candidatus Thiodiazotropha sp.]
MDVTNVSNGHPSCSSPWQGTSALKACPSIGFAMLSAIVTVAEELLSGLPTTYDHPTYRLRSTLSRSAKNQCVCIGHSSVIPLDK